MNSDITKSYLLIYYKVLEIFRVSNFMENQIHLYVQYTYRKQFTDNIHLPIKNHKKDTDFYLRISQFIILFFQSKFFALGII